jgi:hypothetical protein
MTRPVFESFPKIPRLRRHCIISEKIDGTNAQICITPDGEIYAGSRNRWIDVNQDNAGFARWVEDHNDELISGLGPGTHYGEWWGQGINRRYGLNEKRFSLFNSERWTDEVRPKCCHVVPVLYRGGFSDEAVQQALLYLRQSGSAAAPGWMNPEGVVVYMTSSSSMYKILLDNDELPKGITTYGERKAAETAQVRMG